MTEVSQVLGISVQGARKWCKKNNCAVKIGGRYFLTKQKLLANFPELTDKSEDLEDYTTYAQVH